MLDVGQIVWDFTARSCEMLSIYRHSMKTAFNWSSIVDQRDPFSSGDVDGVRQRPVLPWFFINHVQGCHERPRLALVTSSGSVLRQTHTLSRETMNHIRVTQVHFMILRGNICPSAFGFVRVHRDYWWKQPQSNDTTCCPRPRGTWLYCSMV